MKNRLVELENTLDNLRKKRIEQWNEIIGRYQEHFKGHWVQEEVHRNYYLEDYNNPEPIDDDGRIEKRMLDAMDKEIKRLEDEIPKVKAELINKPLI